MSEGPLSADVVLHRTLQKIISRLPIHAWNAEELSALVSTKYGVITGFVDILEDIRQLENWDLGDIEPAGGLCPRMANHDD